MDGQRLSAIQPETSNAIAGYVHLNDSSVLVRNLVQNLMFHADPANQQGAVLAPSSGLYGAVNATSLMAHPILFLSVAVSYFLGIRNSSLLQDRAWQLITRLTLNSLKVCKPAQCSDLLQLSSYRGYYWAISSSFTKQGCVWFPIPD
ncbi:hypothetical protein AVEN_136977-1 [Araneus ventricosus]|uniref:Uncharacterized protein n=1 Tax=Araneus ventricosus TaxID=182803 RepID=A0A4Y2BHU7_ARAVE|nr:hypothetical protein AVEN_136977-1 [Araneus ventricosus]